MRKGGKKSAADAIGDSNLWMVTFCDLIMLLLTFFVLLLSMSSMDQKKLKEVFRHMKEATGVLELSGYGKVGDVGELVKKYAETGTKIVIDQEHLIDFFGHTVRSARILRETEKNLSELVDIRDDERGIVFTFHENILFESGEAELQEKVFPILDAIAGAIRTTFHEILILGHTDNTPLRTADNKSNWDLSLDRAFAVLKYFLEKKHLSPARFSVGGYGPARPLHANKTGEKRALNRRVEIIFRHLRG
jgi:chemotaxis protein MotB